MNFPRKSFKINSIFQIAFQHLCDDAWPNEWHNFFSTDHGGHLHVIGQFRFWDCKIFEIYFNSFSNENEKSENSQALKTMDLSLIKFVVVVLASNCIVYLYCYVGSLTTDQFFRYGDVPYEFPWYKLPVDLQRYFPLIITNAQRAQCFNGLNIIDLNLVIFTKVRNTDDFFTGSFSSEWEFNSFWFSDNENCHQLLHDVQTTRPVTDV